MAQALFQRKQLLSLIQRRSTVQFSRRALKTFSRRQVRQLMKGGLGLTGVAILLAWNWKLVLATGSGIGLMMLVYALQGWNWQGYKAKWQRYLSGSQGKFTIAVGSGGFAALSTYIAASIWADSENRWLATGSILQGFGTLVTLLLVFWQAIGQPDRRDESKFEQLLADLTHIDPLKRLIAVRQLTHLVSQGRLSSAHQHQLVDYFRLMLSQEQEPVIREAILESLQPGDREVLNPLEPSPVKLPLHLKRI